MIDEVGREEMSMMNDVMHAASVDEAKKACMVDEQVQK
jgi:hypothetical protein